MKKLTLTGKLQSRLARLKTGVEELYFQGLDPHNLANQVCVAVVGTRKPTPYGKELTEKIVTDLAGEGVIIISGLAFGVDILAHTAALDANGQTIAVLPSDINHIYPASNRRTARRIEQAGTLISEHEHNPQPMAHEFLERNRIIAALSDAVFIPEAAARSGSLNTAMHARSMNIPVFAAPGRAIDLMSAGTNKLIATRKATMATEASDILKTLNIKTKKARTPKKPHNTHETALLMAIQSGIHDTTLLQQELNIDTAKLQTTLTMLEINGYIIQDELGSWQLSA